MSRRDPFAQEPLQPIRVHAPDGRVVHFPAMMHPAEIQGEMEKLFPPEAMSAHKVQSALRPLKPAPTPPPGGGLGTALDFNRDTPNTLLGQLGGIGSMGNAIFEALGAVRRQPDESEDTYQARRMEAMAGMALPFKGNLFHGTQNVFEEFSDDAARAAESLYGPGHYFTTDPTVASSYALTKRPPRIPMGDAERAKHFTPGNIVPSYGGHDRVIAYVPGDETNAWRVKVQSVQRGPGGEWIDEPGSRPRWHFTNPVIEPTGQPHVRVQEVELKNPFDVEEAVDPATVEKLIEHYSTPKERMADYPLYARIRQQERDREMTNHIRRARTNDELYRALQIIHTGDAQETAEVLQKVAGYDGIMYPGGQRVRGATPHQAYVAFTQRAIRPAKFPAMSPAPPPPRPPPK
jgi:hypothetical protein